MTAMSGRKRSTCDHRCLFQDHLKAVTLAHQYDMVNRIAWLLQLKTLLSFFLTVILLLSGARYKTLSCTAGLYIVRQRVNWCLVKYRRADYSTWPIMLRWILSEPYCKRTNGSLTNRSISTSKLSALQHRCLRFLLLLTWTQRLLWTEIKYSFDQRNVLFITYGANLRRAQNQTHIWTTNPQTKTRQKCLWTQNTWYIYLSVAIKPCPPV